MATYGLGNFTYEITVQDKSANFKFWDQDDVQNSADTSLDAKELPEGQAFDSRDAAELAYAKVSDDLNKVRDERLKKEVVDAENARLERDGAARASADDFLKTAEHNATEPAGEEKREDGTTNTVYNTANAESSQEAPKKK